MAASSSPVMAPRLLWSSIASGWKAELMSAASQRSTPREYRSRTSRIACLSSNSWICWSREPVGAATGSCLAENGEIGVVERLVEGKAQIVAVAIRLAGVASLGRKERDPERPARAVGEVGTGTVQRRGVEHECVAGAQLENGRHRATLGDTRVALERV